MKKLDDFMKEDILDWTFTLKRKLRKWEALYDYDMKEMIKLVIKELKEKI